MIGRLLLPANVRFLKSALLRPVILCGQHPLVTYCTGGLLAIMGTVVFAELGADFGSTITINMAGWTASPARTNTEHQKLKRTEPTCEGAERFSWGVFSDSVCGQRLCMRSGKMWMGRSAEIEVPVGSAV